MGGGVGRGVPEVSLSFLFLGFIAVPSGQGVRAGPELVLREDTPIVCTESLGRGGWDISCCEGAVALTLNEDAGGLTGSSATRWEPGSARVPTFCAVPLGKASGEGDLPLDGDGGGDPKREPSSSYSLFDEGVSGIALTKS